MGILRCNVGAECDQCGTAIPGDAPVYVIDGDEPEEQDDLVFCSHACLADNLLNYTPYQSASDYLRTLGPEPYAKPKRQP